MRLFSLLLVLLLFTADMADAAYRSRTVKVQKKGSPVWVKSHFRGVPPKAPAKLSVRPRPVVIVPPATTSDPKPAVKVEVKVAPQ